MALRTSVRQVRDVTVIDLAGRITLGEGCALLRQTIRDLLGRGERNILLNLAEVTYIDSAGLGELVGSHVSVSNAGGRLKLLHSQSRIRDLLQVTRLHTVFESYENQSLALLSFE